MSEDTASSSGVSAIEYPPLSLSQLEAGAKLIADDERSIFNDFVVDRTNQTHQLPQIGTNISNADYYFAGQAKREYFRSLIANGVDYSCGVSRTAFIECRKEHGAYGRRYKTECIPLLSNYQHCFTMVKQRLNSNCNHLGGLLQRALYENEGQDRVDKFYTKLSKCLLTGLTNRTKDIYGVEEIIFRRRKELKEKEKLIEEKGLSQLSEDRFRISDAQYESLSKKN